MTGYISGLNDQFNPQFKKEIIDLIEQIIDEHKRQAGEKNDETTTKQQILILHYLGIINQIDIVNTKKALLFSKLLNRDNENIRKYLTYVNAVKIGESDIKTKSNLEAVLKIFEELNLDDQIASVKKDLDKIR